MWVCVGVGLGVGSRIPEDNIKKIKQKDSVVCV